MTTLLLSCPHRLSLFALVTSRSTVRSPKVSRDTVSPNSYDGLSYIYFFTGRRERFILTKFTKKKPFGLIICEPTISFYISFPITQLRGLQRS